MLTSSILNNCNHPNQPIRKLTQCSYIIEGMNPGVYFVRRPPKAFESTASLLVAVAGLI
jgi:hypothetical protein